MSGNSNKLNSTPPASDNEPQPNQTAEKPRFDLYDMGEAAIQQLLQAYPTMTREEICEQLDVFGFLDRRLYIPQ